MLDERGRVCKNEEAWTTALSALEGKGDTENWPNDNRDKPSCWA